MYLGKANIAKIWYNIVLTQIPIIYTLVKTIYVNTYTHLYIS